MTFYKFSLKENVTEILAIMVVFMSFIFLMLLIFKPLPIENKEMVNTAVGFIIGASITGVIGYYFGTSKNRNYVPTEPGQSVTTIQKSTITETPDAKAIDELNYQLGKAKTAGDTIEIERVLKLIKEAEKK